MRVTEMIVLFVFLHNLRNFVFKRHCQLIFYTADFFIVYCWKLKLYVIPVQSTLHEMCLE